MKKMLIPVLLGLFVSSIAISQSVIKFPATGNPIIEMTVPTSQWSVQNENSLLSITPKDSGESSRLITMIWGSKTPTAETAVDDLVNEAFDVIEALLTDIVWAEDMSDFESNGMSFVALDGYGYYVNDNGTKDRMSTSVMIFFPDESNILTLVFFGTDVAYDKWETSLLEIILSIKPVSL